MLIKKGDRGKTTILIFVVIVSWLIPAQSMGIKNTLQSYTNKADEPQGRNPINSFIQSKVDSELIYSQENRDFEIGMSWSGLDYREEEAHSGISAGRNIADIIEVSLNDVTSDISMGENDSLLLSIWAKTMLSLGIFIDIQKPMNFASPELNGNYQNISAAVISTEASGLNIQLRINNLPRGEQGTFFDDASLIWRRVMPSYQTNLVSEPNSVFYNNSELTEGNAGIYIGEDEWDWDNGILYINVGENPSEGVVEYE